MALLSKGLLAMPGTMFTDLGHFFDDEELPSAARRLRRYFLAIIYSLEDLDECHVADTGVRCRRRPGRKPCPGEIQAVWEDTGAGPGVTWECPSCGDNGYISGIPYEISDFIFGLDFWCEDEVWDEEEGEDKGGEERTGSGTDLPPLPSTAGEPEMTCQTRRIWEKIPVRQRMMILNNTHCPSCRRIVSMQLVAGSISDDDLVLTGRCLYCRGDLTCVVHGVGHGA